MKKLVFILLLFSNLLFGKTLATIGKYKITDNDVIAALNSDGIVDYDDAKFQEKLNSLIEEKKLLLYANQNNIKVDDKEVETFFIHEFGNHPSFSTNGAFDYSKYLRLKNNPKIKLIFKSIKKDLLLKKTKSIICDQFQLSDENLLEEYIKRNAKLDLNYAILPTDMIDVPSEFDPMEVYNFNPTISKEYFTDEKVKADFCVINDSTFKNRVIVNNKEIVQLFNEKYSNSAPFDELKDSLKTILWKKKSHELAKSFSDSLLVAWSLSDSISYPVLHSGYLRRGDKFYNIPKGEEIVNSLFDLDSQPKLMEIKGGFVLYKLVDKINKKHLTLKDNPKLFWEKYRDFKMKELSKTKYKDIYLQNLDKFISPAVSLNYIIINKPNPGSIKVNKDSLYAYYLKNFANVSDSTFSRESAELRNLYIQHKISKKLNELKAKLFLNFYDEKKLNSIIKKYNLEVEKKLIFVGKISNSNYYDNLVAQSIRKFPSRKVYYVQDENKMIIYSIDSIFDDYLPTYDEVKNQVYKYVNLPKQKFDAHEFYNNHKEEFFIPDSLQIGGAFIPINTDTVSVDTDELRNYYNEHIDNFEISNSCLFDYICLDKSKSDLANEIYRDLSKTPFQLMKSVFSKKGEFDETSYYEYNKLPKSISNVLKKMSKNQYSAPISFHNNLYIFRLKNTASAHVQAFDEAKEFIKRKLVFQKAKSIAFNFAKTIFDSTSYYSQCKTFADSSWLFKTKFQSIKDSFAPISNINSILPDLKRLYKYEKLNRIVSDKTGFAVLYKLNYKKGRYQTFEESQSKIEKLYQMNNKDVFAYNFVKKLEDKISEGVNPDSLLFFFGGYHRLRNLTIDSDISNLPFGKFIINDAISKKNGEFSNPIKIDEKHYFFYQVDSIRKVKTRDFRKNKYKFQKYLENIKYQNWLRNY